MKRAAHPPQDAMHRPVMASFAAVHAETTRQLILRCLASQSGQRTNDAMLRTALHGLGVVVSRAECMRHLRWLDDRAFIEMCDVAGTSDICAIATLTSRGAEVAQERAETA